MPNTILVLSDDPTRSTALAQQLATRPIDPTIATSFDEVLQRLFAVPFDAIFVEVVMTEQPVVDFVLRVREVAPRARLMVACPAPHVLAESDAWRLGVDDVLPYDIAPDAMARNIAAALTRASRRHPRHQPCVGREREQVAMEGGLVSALGGVGSIILVSGEAGVGKSRGLTWLSNRVLHEGGVSVLACARSDDRFQSYGLWIEALDRLMDVDPDSRAFARHMLACNPSLVALMPRLRRFASGVTATELDIETVRAAVDHMLRDASSRRLVGIAFDDVHLADRHSVELLRREAAAIGGMRVLMSATYRPSAAPAVRASLDALERQSGHLVLRLGRLDDAGIAQLLRRHRGQEPSAEDIALARASTDGNPARLVALVRDGVDPSSREWTRCVGEKIDRLPEQTRDLVAIVAVAGVDIDAGLLVEACRVGGRDFNRRSVETALQPAIDAYLLRPILEHTRWAFTHPAVRPLMLARCPTVKKIHARLATVLSRMHASAPDAHAAEIARHFLAADSGSHREKTVEFVGRAVALATRHFELNDAIAMISTLLDGQVLRDDPRRCDWSCTLAKLLWRRGRPDEAIAYASEALEMSRRSGDARRFAAAVLARGGRPRGFGTPMRDRTLVSLAEEALVRDGIDDADRARLHAVAADEQRYSLAPERSVEHAERARQLACAQNDRALSAEIASMLQWQQWPLNDRRRGALLIEELGADREDLRRRFDVALARAWLAWEEGDPHLEQRVDQVVRLAREIGEPYQWWLAELLEIAFDVHRAHESWDVLALEKRLQRCLSTGRTINPEAAVAYFAGQLASAWLWKGLLAGHIGMIDGLRELFPAVGPLAHGLKAVTFAYEGRLDEARHEVSCATIDDVPRDDLWLPAVSLLSDAVGLVGDEPRARRLHEILLSSWSRIVTMPPVIALLPVDYYLGRAATVFDADLALRHLDAARRLEVGLGRPAALAAIDVATAEALRARGRAEDAHREATLLKSARRTCERLELAALARRVESQFGSPITTTPEVIEASMRFAAAYCWIRFGRGPERRYRRSVGLEVVGYLVSSHEPYLSNELAAMVDNPGPQPIAHEVDPDEGAHASGGWTPGAPTENPLRRDAMERLAFAEATGNEDEIAKAKEVLRQIRASLSADPSNDKSRSRITKAVGRTYRKVRKQDVVLAEHLEAQISTGRFCMYRRSLAQPVEWTVTWES